MSQSAETHTINYPTFAQFSRTQLCYGDLTKKPFTQINAQCDVAQKTGDCCASLAAQQTPLSVSLPQGLKEVKALRRRAIRQVQSNPWAGYSFV